MRKRSGLGGGSKFEIFFNPKWKRKQVVPILVSSSELTNIICDVIKNIS